MPLPLRFAWLAPVAAALLFSARASAEEQPCGSGRDRRNDPQWCSSNDGSIVRAGHGGLRVSSTTVQGSDHDTDGAGIALQLAGGDFSYESRGYASSRATSFGFIGGGALGFEGGFGGDAAAGVRSSRSPGALFLRLGMRGHLFGNKRLYSSLLELPQVQIGFQILDTHTALELAGRAGPVLVGRYSTGDDARRRLGDAFEMGGHLGVHAKWIHMELEYMQIRASHPGGPVHTITASLCGHPGFLVLCMDGRYFRGDERLHQTGADGAPITHILPDTEAFYGGFSIGFEQRATRVPPHPPAPPAPPPRAPAVIAE